MALDQPHETDEIFGWEAILEGRVLRIAIGRETIEDYLRVESTTPEERLKFVTQNKLLLEHCALMALKDAPDAPGITLKPEQLPKRK